MSVGDLLRAKSSEYELLAEWHGERVLARRRALRRLQAMVVVGIVLREVAEAIDVEWGQRADVH